MIRRPPRSTRTDTLFPYTTLFRSLSHDSILPQDPVARALFYQPDGQALPVGALLRNPDLAETLRRIATDGADAFYRGPVAEAIVAAVRGHPTNPGDMTEDRKSTRLNSSH